jgi:hypothetical protein
MFEYYSTEEEVIEYRLNYIFLAIFLPIRLWYIFKYFIISSYYFTPRAHRFCRIYSTRLTFAFTLKCLLKSKPIVVLLCLFSANVFMGGYLVRIWERRLFEHNVDLENYINCVWYAFTTMCTVCYGDMEAATLPGRIFSMIISIFGIIITSIVTVVLTDNFTFKGGELKAYNLLNHIKMREKMFEVTKKLFTKCGIIFLNKIRKNRSKNNNESDMYDEIIEKLNKEKIKILIEINNLKQIAQNSHELDYISLIIDRLVHLKDYIKSNLMQMKQVKSISTNILENQTQLEVIKNKICTNLQNEDDIVY